MIKVSVIIPVYNVEPYIERCARSLFDQTLDEVEYIFVNDCTQDRSIDVLKRILQEYPQIKEMVRIVDMPTNSGQAAVRRHGMQLAQGEYLIHCDSDDWVDPHMYEKLYNLAKSGDYDMVWCDYYRSDGITHKHISQKSIPKKENLIRDFLSSRLMGSVWNRLYKRRLQINNFIYPQADMTEDLVISVQIAMKSEKIGYLPEPLYYYYYNPSSICLNPSEERIVKNLNGIVNNTQLILSIIENNGYSGLMSLEIECKKFTCKEILIPLLHKKEYRRLWIDTYPEVNNIVRNNPYIPKKSKFRAFCMLNDLYLLYAVTRSLSQILAR